MPKTRMVLAIASALSTLTLFPQTYAQQAPGSSGRAPTNETASQARVAALVLLTVAVALLSAPSAADAQRAWHCENQFLDPRTEAQVEARAHNITMRYIILAYMYRWDAAYMRQTCDRAVRGETVDMSCLNGRRNWNEIHAMIPAEYYGMSSSALRPYRLSLDEEGRSPHFDAYDYCVEIGAVVRPALR